MFNILVICTANICRSPVAKVILRSYFEKKNISVESAGTHALNGNFVDPTMGAIARSRGYLEIDDHRSRTLLPSHVGAYDLILCMDKSHVRDLCRMTPFSTGRVMLLGRWDNNLEVADPIGCPTNFCENVVTQMEHHCLQWATRINEMGLAA